MDKEEAKKALKAAASALKEAAKKWEDDARDGAKALREVMGKLSEVEDFLRETEPGDPTARTLHVMAEEIEDIYTRLKRVYDRQEEQHAAAQQRA